MGKLIVVHTFTSIYSRKTETQVRDMIAKLKRADYAESGVRRVESSFRREGDDLIMTIREPVRRLSRRKTA